MTAPAPALTAAQIARVRDSFAAIAPRTDEAARLFYGRLFTLAPDTRPLFKTDLASQGRKLFQTLAAVVDALDQPETLVPAAEALAIRHIGYGAQPRHYQVVGAALFETLRGALGPAFDHVTEDAWETAYELLSDVMLAADAAARAR